MYQIRFLRAEAKSKNAIATATVDMSGKELSDLERLFCDAPSPITIDDMRAALADRSMPTNGTHLIAVYKMRGKSAGRPSMGKKRIDVTLTERQLEHLEGVSNRSEYIGQLIDSQIILNRTHEIT